MIHLDCCEGNTAMLIVAKLHKECKTIFNEYHYKIIWKRLQPQWNPQSMPSNINIALVLGLPVAVITSVWRKLLKLVKAWAKTSRDPTCTCRSCCVQPESLWEVGFAPPEAESLWAIALPGAESLWGVGFALREAESPRADQRESLLSLASGSSAAKWNWNLVTSWKLASCVFSRFLTPSNSLKERP